MLKRDFALFLEEPRPKKKRKKGKLFKSASMSNLVSSSQSSKNSGPKFFNLSKDFNLFGTKKKYLIKKEQPPHISTKKLLSPRVPLLKEKIILPKLKEEKLVKDGRAQNTPKIVHRNLKDKILGYEQNYFTHKGFIEHHSCSCNTSLLYRKSINNIPISNDYVPEYKNIFSTLSEKNRYNKIVSKLTKLKAMILLDEKNSFKIIKEFMRSNGIKKEILYKNSYLLNFLLFILNDFSVKIDPNRDFKAIIKDALENKIDTKKGNFVSPFLAPKKKYVYKSPVKEDRNFYDIFRLSQQKKMYSIGENPQNNSIQEKAIKNNSCILEKSKSKIGHESPKKKDMLNDFLCLLEEYEKRRKKRNLLLIEKGS